MYKLPKIPVEELVKGRVYEIWCRNLSYGVWDGEAGFIGIRTKFGSHFLFKEYHYDKDLNFGTVRGMKDLEVDVPKDIEIKESLGAQDRLTGRPVRFITPTAKIKGGWIFTDTDESAPEVRAYSIRNDKLFNFLKELEVKHEGPDRFHK